MDETKYLDINSYNQNKKNIPSFFEEFLDFLNELWSMIYNDARNSYFFLKENKKYISTVVILAFLLQFTNISNLGTSFDKYCNTQVKQLQLQKGGNNNVQTLTFQEIGKLRAEAEASQAKDKKKEKASQKLQKKVQKAVDKDSTIHPEEKRKELLESDQKAKNDAEMKKGSKEVAKGFSTKMKEKRFQDDLLKANQERLSFFEGLKNKFSGSSLGSTLGGPLFGRMDLIFDTVKNIFYFIGLILMFAGIISLPVLIFLIITYMVFKSMVSKFIIL